MNANPQSQERRIAGMTRAAQPRQRPEHQASSARRDRAAPIAVHPLIERTELDDGQQPADERPSGRRPRAQHPIAQRAERTDAQRNASPRMAEEGPADGENQALAERKNRGVRGLLQHEERFEELVQRMCAGFARRKCRSVSAIRR
jgi:hypothetical protein